MAIVKSTVEVFSSDGESCKVEGLGVNINSNNPETAIKGAETDAVKRALRWLGIGAFLYDRPLSPEPNGTTPPPNRRRTHISDDDGIFED